MKSSEESVGIAHKIDSIYNQISSMLSFVTFTNVAISQCTMYAVVFICYALVYVKNHRAEKILEKSLSKSKEVTLETVKVERY